LKVALSLKATHSSPLHLEDTWNVMNIATFKITNSACR